MNTRILAWPARALFLIALAALPLQAAVLPADIPAPDPSDKGNKDKPVKVYILSGQSNMLGFGRVEGAAPFYSQVFLSADPTASECKLPMDNYALLRFGVFQSAANDAEPGGIAGDAMKVALGSTKETIPGSDGGPVAVKAFIEVTYTGTYRIHPSGDAMVKVKDAAPGETDGEVRLEKGMRYPIEITYAKGGGSAALWLEMTELKGMGDLRFVVETLGRFPYMLDDQGKWTVRNDVMLNDAYMGKGKSDPLSAPACGPTFGPELGFGYVMGEFHDEPVIVMKADIGNRSLGWDILPPGSERYVFEGKEQPGYKEMFDADGNVVPWDGKGWYAGKQYDDYTAAVRAVLENFGERYPEYADQGYEVAGFVWWQGHKDGPNPAHNARYEQNLVNLIKAWRKEFNVPKAKWAIATVGFDGENMPEHYVKIAEAQKAVADPERHPELAGTVMTIDTRPFWRGPEVSPRNQGYHYNHNAETYMLTGDALGRAMVELYGGETEYPDPRMPGKVDPLPMLTTPDNEALIAMRAALRPIVLDKLIPDFVTSSAKIPGYLRRGMELGVLVENKAPKNPTANLTTQLDKVTGYYQLLGIDDYDWKPAGPDMRLAEWEYFSFDPTEKKTGAEGDRYRPVTLPAGMENWASPDFDAAMAGWNTGKAPFGQKEGKKIALRERCGNPQCHCDVTPNTLWEKEVLLIRGKFRMPTFEDSKRYRIVVGGGSHVWAGEGFALYINGEQVAEMTGGYYKSGGDPRGTYLFNHLRPQVENQEITIAVKAFLRQNGHRNKPAPPSGHLSVWLEEMTLPPAVASMQP